MPESKCHRQSEGGNETVVSYQPSAFYSANVASLCLREANGNCGKNVGDEWMGFSWERVPAQHVSW